MGSTLPPPGEHRLEGLCDDPAPADRGAVSDIRLGQGAAGIERLEARFVGRSYAPHRHDTYAIGVTMAGLQTFQYRGARRHCLAGQCHVLHPDELHDGAPGDAAGFRYRIIHIDPALIRASLGEGPLPFVADPVVTAPTVRRALAQALSRLDDPIDPVEQAEITAALADFLVSASATAPRRPAPLRLPALNRARDLIAADPTRRPPIETLETASDLDRWTLARQFRAAFGVSPSQFRTMRQLDLARRSIHAGATLADAAIDAGFADQSHMSRLFKRAYGLTPGRWAAATTSAAGSRPQTVR